MLYFLKKTLKKKMKFDFVDKLIEDREFYEPTISCMSKFKSIKIPIVCEKCLQTSSHNDKQDDSRNTSLNSSFGYFTPSGINSSDKRLCLMYKTKKRSQSNIEIGDAKIEKNSINLPKIKKQKYEIEARKSTKEAKKKLKEQELPMNEGDIRFRNTKSGLEVKRLPSKNCLITDIFKSDAFTDETQKMYMDWLKKQQEGEQLTQTNKKKNYLLEYESQLNEILKNVKKGALPYEVQLYTHPKV
jgi:hypothetical protein